MMLHPSLGAILVVSLTISAGCRKSPPPLVAVEGSITLDGRPLPRASILLFPTFKGFGSDLIALATADDKGRFQLECGLGKGACIGTYKATVTEAPVPPDLMRNSRNGDVKIRQFYDDLPNRPIPVRFGDLATTPLQIEIVQGKTSYELSLKR